MLTSPQFTRSAVIAATVLSLAATPAVARQADMPVRPNATVVVHSRQWTPPRTDGLGVRPPPSPPPPPPWRSHSRRTPPTASTGC